MSRRLREFLWLPARLVAIASIGAIVIARRLDAFRAGRTAMRSGATSAMEVVKEKQARGAEGPGLVSGQDADPVAATKPRLLLLYSSTALPSWVQADVRALSRAYRVEVVPSLSGGEMLESLAHVRRNDILLCWFGHVGYLPAALLARFSGKPVVIVTGGIDVAREPAIAYGNMREGVAPVLARILFRLADIVLPVSEAAKVEATRNARVPEQRQRVVYHGFDSSQVETVDPARKESLVVTVGQLNASSIRRKGILDLIDASKLLPDVPFVIAGSGNPDTLALLRHRAGSNVTVAGYLPARELADLYRRARVYCQPSVHEAFGAAVAEAMLYNCIPVVTPAGALPEVVGESGLYAPLGDPAGLARVLRTALSADYVPKESPRDRVARLFPASARERVLLEIVSSLMPTPPERIS